jgi:hypothetical protein
MIFTNKPRRRKVRRNKIDFKFRGEGRFHPSHRLRFSEAATYDNVCAICSATDAVGDYKLARSCPGPRPPTARRDLIRIRMRRISPLLPIKRIIRSANECT